MSAPEELLAFQLKAVGIPFEREVAFAAPRRRWRADFIVRKCPLGYDHCKAEGPEDIRLLIEIDGGGWSGGRHVSGSGFQADMEKHNAAVLLGYRVLRFSPADVDSGAALRVVEEALKCIGAPIPGSSRERLRSSAWRRSSAIRFFGFRRPMSGMS